MSPRWIPFALFLFILPFPGTVALRLLCLAAALILTLYEWRRMGGPRIPIPIPLAAWAAMAFVSLTYAADPAYSLGEIKNEIGYSLMAFIAFLGFVRNERTLFISCTAALVSITLISCWGIGDMVMLGYWSEAAPHVGVGTFATFAVVSLPITLVVWPMAGNRMRIVLLAMVLAVTTASILSQQRILLLVLVLQGNLMLILLARRRMLILGRTLLVTLAIGAPVAAGTGMLLVHKTKFDASLAEFQSLGNDMRLQHWSRIVAQIQERPFSGAGFGRDAMRRAYPELIPDKPPYSLLWHPHNVFLTYGIGMGLPGMIVLLLLAAGLLREYWRGQQRDDSRDVFCAVAGIALVFGVFARNMTNDFFLRDGALIFWALNGALLGYVLRAKPASGKPVA